MSVKDITDKLFKMMEVPSGSGGGSAGAVPPLVTFQWGEMIPFKAACTSLTVAFQLFKPNGSPIRADVKLALMQWNVEGALGQNPTTRSSGALGTHIVRDGDSLASISHDVYGDPTQWRAIAVANGIDDPLRLRSGRALSIPSLDA